MLINIITGTPWWVFLLLIILLRIGYKARFNRTIKVKTLLITPSIFLFLQCSSLYNLYFLRHIAILYSIVGILLGIIIGIALGFKQLVAVDRKNYLIHLKGSYLPLIIIICNFSLQYLVNVLVALNYSINYGYLQLILLGSTIFTGIIIGRTILYIYKFFSLTHTNLCKMEN